MNSKRKLNFYKKIERLNVAVSRAQEKLIIVGAVENYLRHEIIINNTKKILNIWFKIINNNMGVIRTWEI
ncbi:AAA domain-containing protein [Spiroplasma taiwanense]|uniref:AAA domain-containing protein n=1 Tax=Spiroplasma taiwanense TaxID=2145 RepID=UPI0038CD933D